VIATGGAGADTFGFYGAQAGLQTHLTITDFEIGVDHIDISKLLGAQWSSASADLESRLDELIGAATFDADGVYLDLSSLMSNVDAQSAHVQLTIGHATTQSMGVDGATQVTPLSGQGIKNALTTAVFEATSVASDMWLSDLTPLVYPNAT